MSELLVTFVVNGVVLPLSCITRLKDRGPTFTTAQLYSIILKSTTYDYLLKPSFPSLPFSELRITPNEMKLFYSKENFSTLGSKLFDYLIINKCHQDKDAQEGDMEHMGNMNIQMNNKNSSYSPLSSSPPASHTTLSSSSPPSSLPPTHKQIHRRPSHRNSITSIPLTSGQSHHRRLTSLGFNKDTCGLIEFQSQYNLIAFAVGKTGKTCKLMFFSQFNPFHEESKLEREREKERERDKDGTGGGSGSTLPMSDKEKESHLLTILNNQKSKEREKDKEKDKDKDKDNKENNKDNNNNLTNNLTHNRRTSIPLLAALSSSSPMSDPSSLFNESSEASKTSTVLSSSVDNETSVRHSTLDIGLNSISVKGNHHQRENNNNNNNNNNRKSSTSHLPPNPHDLFPHGNRNDRKSISADVAEGMKKSLNLNHRVSLRQFLLDAAQVTNNNNNDDDGDGTSGNNHYNVPNDDPEQAPPFISKCKLIENSPNELVSSISEFSHSLLVVSFILPSSQADAIIDYHKKSGDLDRLELAMENFNM